VPIRRGSRAASVAAREGIGFGTRDGAVTLPVAGDVAPGATILYELVFSFVGVTPSFQQVTVRSNFDILM
jgi:hypothetical protein